MSIKKIRQVNGQQFIDDLARVSEVMTRPTDTGEYFYLRKSDVRKAAMSVEIQYYITTHIFIVKRETMVVI